MTKLQPLAADSRIVSLDILRGFALFGIALVNVFGFNASFFDFGGFYNNLPDPAEQKFYQILIGLTADKFIFLYSFLFGYGFYLQYKKFRDSQAGFIRFYKRRLLWLAIFGICHVVLLWAGDILLMYALAGSILLMIRNFSDRKLAFTGLFFYFFIGIWLTVAVWIKIPDAMTSTCTQCLNDAKAIYPTGTWFSCLKLRLLEYASFRNINLFYYFPKILGIFIFGYLASKNKLHVKIQKNSGYWSIVLVITAIVATLYYLYYEKVIFLITGNENAYLNALYMTAYELMNLLLASSYILLIFVLTSVKSVRNILMLFSFAGRMSLTNYLGQSVIFSIIFYGWGFGLFGMTQPTHFIWFAIIAFVFQVITSYVWLRFFDQGPMEKLWRKLSYKN